MRETITRGGAQRGPDRVRLLIAEWRDFLGISQRELARRSGLSTAVISRLVNDEREWKASHLVALARGLEIPPHYLLVYDPSKGESLVALAERVSPDDQPRLARIIRAYLDGSGEGGEGGA